VLHELNAPQLHEKLSHGLRAEIAHLTPGLSDDGSLAEEMYLTFYSRFPSDGDAGPSPNS